MAITREHLKDQTIHKSLDQKHILTAKLSNTAILNELTVYYIDDLIVYGNADEKRSSFDRIRRDYRRSPTWKFNEESIEQLIREDSTDDEIRKILSTEFNGEANADIILNADIQAITPFIFNIFLARVIPSEKSKHTTPTAHIFPPKDISVKLTYNIPDKTIKLFISYNSIPIQRDGKDSKITNADGGPIMTAEFTLFKSKLDSQCGFKFQNINEEDCIPVIYKALRGIECVKLDEEILNPFFAPQAETEAKEPATKSPRKSFNWNLPQLFRRKTIGAPGSKSAPASPAHRDIVVETKSEPTRVVISAVTPKSDIDISKIKADAAEEKRKKEAREERERVRAKFWADIEAKKNSEQVVAASTVSSTFSPKGDVAARNRKSSGNPLDARVDAPLRFVRFG